MSIIVVISDRVAMQQHRVCTVMDYWRINSCNIEKVGVAWGRGYSLNIHVLYCSILAGMIRK